MVNLKAGEDCKFELELKLSCCLDDECERYLCTDSPSGICEHSEYPRESHYSCELMDQTVFSDGINMRLGIFDMDNGAATEKGSEQVEVVRMYGFESYDFVQPSSYPLERVDELNSKVEVSQLTERDDGSFDGVFTASQIGTGSDNPNEPKSVWRSSNTGMSGDCVVKGSRLLTF